MTSISLRLSRSSYPEHSQLSTILFTAQLHNTKPPGSALRASPRISGEDTQVTPRRVIPRADTDTIHNETCNRAKSILSAVVALCLRGRAALICSNVLLDDLLIVP